MSAFRYAVSDALVLAKRNLLRIPRAPDLLMSFTGQPVVFVLLFAYVFGGAIDRFRSLPMSRAAVLAGRTLADVVTNSISITVMLVVGVLAGFSFDAPLLHIVAGLLLLLLFGYAFSWVFAFVGLTSSSPETAQSLGFMFIFPLTFVSSAFVPVESMPGALRAFAEVNPFTIVVNAMRSLFLGTPAGNDVWGAVVWSLAITIVFSFLSVRRYKRAVVR